MFEFGLLLWFIAKPVFESLLHQMAEKASSLTHVPDTCVTFGRVPVDWVLHQSALRGKCFYFGAACSRGACHLSDMGAAASGIYRNVCFEVLNHPKMLQRYLTEG